MKKHQQKLKMYRVPSTRHKYRLVDLRSGYSEVFWDLASAQVRGLARLSTRDFFQHVLDWVGPYVEDGNMAWYGIFDNNEDWKCYRIEEEVNN